MIFNTFGGKNVKNYPGNYNVKVISMIACFRTSKIYYQRKSFLHVYIKSIRRVKMSVLFCKTNTWFLSNNSQEGI